ncbi:hypothetical protein [Glycomyces niveus]|uniref:Mannosyl-glycoprotein endo-beta-N-acetylglucosamidase-like domain-containing protein n=1 Tax=Glycomyces niveus TaxID=2820287 RepID=A0ABS3U0W9_9ACTN|nr:hypothetical protein [Glycomyces sp. NEAU-S30]MBO3732418.1 hypothetical protein [Glycomyces sp. NEAU-S30]
MTGLAQSAALSIRKRLKPAFRGLVERSRVGTARAAALAAVLGATLVAFLRNTAAPAAVRLAERLRETAAPVIERAKPVIAWASRRLEPWAALLKDVAAVAAELARPVVVKIEDLARPVVHKVVDVVRPIVSKVVERLGLRVTIMGTATAIFIGSTGSAALAITSMDEPSSEQQPVSAITALELALSDEASAAAGEQIAADQRAAAEAEAKAKEEAAAQAAAEAAKAAAQPKPVDGLSELQMKNAVAIIEAGKDEGLGRDAWAVALATAMQESKFRNYANVNVPESYEYDYQAEGSDHDSVGLFQQRLSWGKVSDLMNPEKSAKKFYKALERVDGWENMSVTRAAQTVQVSAYPDAYAQWEGLAWDIIDSYEKAKS